MILGYKTAEHTLRSPGEFVCALVSLMIGQFLTRYTAGGNFTGH